MTEKKTKEFKNGVQYNEGKLEVHLIPPMAWGRLLDAVGIESWGPTKVDVAEQLASAQRKLFGWYSGVDHEGHHRYGLIDAMKCLILALTVDVNTLAGKPHPDVIIDRCGVDPLVTKAVAAVMAAGRAKYWENSHMAGFGTTSLVDASMRHILYRLEGKILDDQINPNNPKDLPTNQPHLGCAIARLLFAYNQQLLGHGVDDRVYDDGKFIGTHKKQEQ